MHTTFPPNDAPQGGALASAGRSGFGQAAGSALGMKWSVLHDAAAIVATLAGLAPETPDPRLSDFPAMMRDVGGWRQNLVEQGIEDLTAIMEPGLGALLAVHARGSDPVPAALALWHEFCTAREALLALAPPPDAQDQRRLI